MAQRYKNQNNTTISIQQGEDTYQVNLAVLTEYLDVLYEKEIISEFEEISDLFDGLVDQALCGSTSEESLELLKKQIILLRETTFLFKDILSKVN